MGALLGIQTQVRARHGAVQVDGRAEVLGALPVVAVRLVAAEHVGVAQMPVVATVEIADRRAIPVLIVRTQLVTSVPKTRKSESPKLVFLPFSFDLEEYGIKINILFSIF